MASEAGAAAHHGPETPTDYIVHHLTNNSVGEGFWTFHLDTLFFSVVMGALFVGIFYLAARRATAETPTGLQNFVEMMVEGIDKQVRETFHGSSAPLRWSGRHPRWVSPRRARTVNHDLVARQGDAQESKW